MSGAIVPFLSLLTLLAVATFALISKARVEERRHDPYAPKSTLAKDGPQGGVAFLMPLGARMQHMPDRVKPFRV
ncbi:MAG: hypothetical protein U0934_02705 [Pseudotabrizicola sp.]|uniref:hypothetical protein n=1 Tax=Pseudotabrizicola sp. TaxID=2939647 RepID=UPI0027192483|nr:hypothetical protein [Pseudotabrizicola sp.]MDO8883762.1 hypothetical protein [Pseudotabrizicola sp.]MDP2083467.1 hypothetical protein [Pseudotabrizicola sp.]MDZ7572852.1 hypothetical protein [Pseudotabrizicola sp.]